MIILELEGSTLIQIDSRLPCQTMALFCYTFCLLCRLHGPLPRGIEAIQCHDLIGRRGINTLQDFTFDYHKKKSDFSLQAAITMLYQKMLTNEII